MFIFLIFLAHLSFAQVGVIPQAEPTPATTPAGSNCQVQFNNSGAFGADSDLCFDTGTKRLTVGGKLLSSNIIFGTGSPEAAVTGSVGDVYQRTDGGAGTTLYIKESGNATNTGWVAVNSSSVTNARNTFTSATSVVVTHNAALATPELAVVTCRDSAGALILWESATFGTDSVTITFAQNETGYCTVNTSGGGSGGALPATVVETDQSNTYTAGAQDFSSATSLKIPISAGGSPSAEGEVLYDTTANQYKVFVDAAMAYLGYFTTGTTSGNILVGGANPGAISTSSYTVQASGSGGTNPTNAGTSTELARKDHEHLVPWAAGLFFAAPPSTGTFALPLPVNNQCGGSISAISVGVTALTQGSGTMTFNVIRYNASGVSQGNLFSVTQSYNNAGTIRQEFTADQNNTSIGSTDYFRVNIISINAQDDFSVVVQGKCKNI